MFHTRSTIGIFIDYFPYLIREGGRHAEGGGVRDTGRQTQTARQTDRQTRTHAHTQRIEPLYKKFLKLLFLTPFCFVFVLQSWFDCRLFQIHATSTNVWIKWGMGVNKWNETAMYLAYIVCISFGATLGSVRTKMHWIYFVTATF